MQINVLDYLEETALRHGEKPAFIDECGELTFAQLLEKAKALGSRIAEQAPGVRRPVAVLTDRWAACIVAYMGALYSGNFYVPVDAALPLARIEAMLGTLDPLVLIASEKQGELARTLEDKVKARTFILEEAQEGPVNEERLLCIREKSIDTDPVYLIFTSGSTGTPKGIVVNHRGVIDLTEWLTDTFGFTSRDVLANQTPFYFDASVKDLYITLKTGATTHILERKYFSFPIKLMEYLNGNKITAILWATSALCLTAASGVLEKKPPDSLEKVFFAGEAMTGKYLNRWRKQLPDAMFVNLYGPTEITVDCTYYIVDRDMDADEAVPIGRACRNMEVLLLDEQGKEILPPGEGAGRACASPSMPLHINDWQSPTGEICVRGSGVAMGYYGDGERSGQVFVQDPRNPFYREIIYRTGDLARYDCRGDLIFSARRDDQIKHMGYRIELGEVEAVALALEEVKACAAFFDSKADKIVLFYQGEGADKKYIIEGMKEKLPKYMLPNVLQGVEALPYTPNGKVDRVKLKEDYFRGTCG